MPNKSDQLLSFTDKRKPVVVFYDIELDDAGLDPYSFRIYQRIARRTAGKTTGQCTEAINAMAAGCRMSRSQVIRSLGVLEKRQMIVKIEQSGKASIYGLLDKSEWIPMPTGHGSDEPEQVDPCLQDTPPMPTGHTPHAYRTHPYKEEEDKEENKLSKAASSPAAEPGQPAQAGNGQNGHTANGSERDARFDSWTEDFSSEHRPATIVEFCQVNAELLKLHSPLGAARKFWQTGEKDTEVWDWLTAREQARAEQARKEKIAQHQSAQMHTIFSAEEQARHQVERLFNTDRAEFDRLTASFRTEMSARLNDIQRMIWDEQPTVWEGPLKSKLIEQFTQEALAIPLTKTDS